MIPTRKEEWLRLFPNESAYRLRQINEALFDVSCRGWQEVTTLPGLVRASLEREVPWATYRTVQVLDSKAGDTYKAILTLVDGKQVETVLMENARGQWTICVSSQVGCAMRCAFCATGKMGLSRQLTSDEITDQYRFWRYFLADRPTLSQRISNVVFMGMGEPLANYDAVKQTLNTWLEYSDLGPSHITVSTVGVLPRLEYLLTDSEWPPVKIAISLHSADAETRRQIVPTSYDNFLPTLAAWADRYLEKFGNRRHHLTFEYVMLRGVNDTPRHADVLAEFVRRIGRVKVNLIPYNFTDSEFERSTDDTIRSFIDTLARAGVIGTRRKTMGDDIAAACGQLIVLSQKKS